jgi:hypothetical protein
MRPAGHGAGKHRPNAIERAPIIGVSGRGLEALQMPLQQEESFVGRPPERLEKIEGFPL